MNIVGCLDTPDEGEYFRTARMWPSFPAAARVNPE